jgi:chitosanase
MASRATARLAVPISELQKKTAQAIVNIFETSHIRGDYGMVTLLAGDSGHLTYGRSQTTLASGNLFLLIRAYCQAPEAHFADAFQPYLERLSARDPTLDVDSSFRRTLQDAGTDPVMQETQDTFFDRVYWSPALQYARNSGLVTGLGTSVVYDSCVHGSWALVRDKVNMSGTAAQIGEQKWVANYVATRRNWLATHSNALLHRCVYRMDSFQQLIQEQRWQLELPLIVRGIQITADLLMTPAVRVSAEAEAHRLLKLETPYMIGEDVLALQTALAVKGFDGKADGIYGPLTEARVRQFQIQAGLKGDGIVGPATRAALGLS